MDNKVFLHQGSSWLSQQISWLEDSKEEGWRWRCPQGESLHHTSEGQTHIKTLPPDPAVKIPGRESLPPGRPPKDRSDDMLMGQQPHQKRTAANVLVEELLHNSDTGLRQSETEGDRYSTVHLQPPWWRKTGQLVPTQESFLNPYLGERLKEKMKEGTETSESDASDEKPLPCTCDRIPSTNRMKFPVSTRLYALHRSSRMSLVMKSHGNVR